MKHTPWMSQKGATAVEFAIVLPLLILLLFGMVEFGLYLFNRHVITNGAREGARAGIIARSVRLSNGEIETVVLNYSKQHLVTFGEDTLEIDDVTIKPIDDNLNDGFDPATNRCVDFGCDLEVQVDFTYNFLFLSTIGIDTLDIQSVASMKME
jgi:hypothetical protein